MAQQCAVTDPQPVHLSGDSTVLYRWGAAVQHSRGGAAMGGAKSEGDRAQGEPLTLLLPAASHTQGEAAWGHALPASQ